MNETRLIVLGAGGHGRVVADVARSMGRWPTIEFLDDARSGELVSPWPVVGRLEEVTALHATGSCAFALGLGDNALRLEWQRRLSSLGASLPNLVDPSATLSPEARIGAGTVLMPQSAVNIGAVLGAACIVNTGATVDHDARVADAVHLSPGVHLGGEVTIGERSWLGVGVSVRHRIEIGARTTVGVGAVVVSDLPDDCVAYGVPARPRPTS